MKIKIYTTKEKEIPDSEIERLEKIIRKKWKMKKNEEVSDEDLLIQANFEGLIVLPEDWKIAE